MAVYAFQCSGSFESVIASTLIRSINPNYVLPDLLSRNHNSIATKLRRIIEKELSSRGTAPKTALDFDVTTVLLVHLAEPIVSSILQIYNKLKTRDEQEVKKVLLPLLQKYIGKPI